MESQPQNPEFRINPKNFHPCQCRQKNNQLDAQDGCTLSQTLI